MPSAAPNEIDRQLPAGDEIFLDHVAHFVRDADAAQQALVRCGFAPTPISIQVNPDPSGGTTPDRNRQRHRDVRARIRGSAVQDRRHAAWRASSMRCWPSTPDCILRLSQSPTQKRRTGGLPRMAFAVRDLVRHVAAGRYRSRQRTAAFTIARVEPGVMPEGRIQMLTHHTEQAVWQKRWLAIRTAPSA